VLYGNYTQALLKSPEHVESSLTQLVESNIISLLSEALSANVQAVLSDQTRTGSADSALSSSLTVVSWV